MSYISYTRNRRFTFNEHLDNEQQATHYSEVKTDQIEHDDSMSKLHQLKVIKGTHRIVCCFMQNFHIFINMHVHNITNYLHVIS